MKRPSQFLGDIQESEHHIKMRWLVLFTTLAFGFVILLWMFYFESSVKIAGPRSANDVSQDQHANLYGVVSE